MRRGEGTLASPSSCSPECLLPPARATQASPPHIHTAPAPTEHPPFLVFRGLFSSLDAYWVAGGMPQPAPFPNMPTAERATVPTYFFICCGSLPSIHKRNLKRK